MIHTSEEFIYEYGYMDGDQFNSSHVSQMIKNAQIQAIKECAQTAEAIMKLSKFTNDDWYAVVDKQSILKLLDQIK